MNSIRRGLALLMTAFFLLLAVSVGLTFWGLEAQASDALVINLAGRQRMLVQQMVRLAGENSATALQNQELQASIEAFEKNLAALQYGGQAVYLPGESLQIPAARDPAVLAQLNTLRKSWEIFRPALEQAQEASPGTERFTAAINALESRAGVLGSQADGAVRLFQAASNRRIERLAWVQGIFFASALLLLAIGILGMRRSILEPLRKLGRSAGLIGAGDLSTPVQSTGAQELRLLAESFESMRLRLNAYNGQLHAWSESLEEQVAARSSDLSARNREIQALYEVTQEILSRLELSQVLHSVTDKTRELMGAETSFLCLLEDNDKVLSLQAISGPEEAVIKTSSPVENRFVTSVLQDTCARTCQARGCHGTCGIMDGAYRASHLAAPLWVGDRVIGALCVGNRGRAAFPAETEALLTRLANAAAVALENARLYRQSERVAALEERQRIAAEMHDGLAQIVNYLGLVIDGTADQIRAGQIEEAQDSLERARRGIDQASVEVRRSIASLQEVSQVVSVQDRLAGLVKEVARLGEQQVEWVDELKEDLFIPHDDVDQVVGVAQEALLNARRYSGAGCITLRLSFSGMLATLSIEDDGIGFDTQASPMDGRQHFGLKILRARAARLGGNLEVHSSPGSGTCIRLTWPVQKAPLPILRFQPNRNGAGIVELS